MTRTPQDSDERHPERGGPGLGRAGRGLAAATAGLAVAGVVLAVPGRPAHLAAALLLLTAAPFGLAATGAARWWALVWAAAIAWPSVVVRLAEGAGPRALLLFAYPLVGVRLGAWWYSGRDGATPTRRDDPAAAESAPSDGLPPATPGRWAAAQRRAADEGRAPKRAGENPGVLPARGPVRFRR